VQVDPADAELWVVRAIQRGLLEAKIDQVARTVSVARANPRTFQESDWRMLESRIGAWKSSVESLMTSIKGGPAAASAHA
jgi:translation initiation factor 3 subunit M